MAIPIFNFCVRFFDKKSAATILALELSTLPVYGMGDPVCIDGIEYKVKDIMHHLSTETSEYTLAVSLEREAIEAAFELHTEL